MKRKHISFTALVAVLVVMCVTTTVFASAAPEDREDLSSRMLSYRAMVSSTFFWSQVNQPSVLL